MPWDHFAFTRWIRDSGLPPTERHMLHALASRSDGRTGETFVSHTVLANDTGMHRSTVVKSLGRLVESGHVVIVGRHGRTITYMLHRTTETSPSATETSRRTTCSAERHVAQNDSNVAQNDSNVAQNDRRCGAERHYQPIYQPSDRPSDRRAARARDHHPPPQGPDRTDGERVSDEQTVGYLADIRQQGEDRRAGFQAREPEPPSGDLVTAIADEIRAYPVFARLDAHTIAEGQAHWCMTGGKKLDWVKLAIRECASKAAAADGAPGGGWEEHDKAERLGSYISKARPQRRAPDSGREQTADDGVYRPPPLYRPPPPPPPEKRPTKEQLEETRRRLAAITKGIGSGGEVA